jgi:hypothetical protein
MLFFGKQLGAALKKKKDFYLFLFYSILIFIRKHKGRYAHRLTCGRERNVASDISDCGSLLFEARDGAGAVTPDCHPAKARALG